MTILNKEKVTYAIQTFLMFLNITKETQSSHVADFEGCKDKALNLLELLIKGKIDPETAAFELNALIEFTNRSLKAPYPTLMGDTHENLVKGEIVAFEHYLNQELKANHLTVQEEAPLFNDSLILWEKVGVSLTAKEGVSEFAALIEKLNRLLPKEEQYPFPDTDQY